MSTSKKTERTLFGQLVIGPPGSGKTTFVNAMAEVLQKLGRQIAIINLDPANEKVEYQAQIDVGNLVKLEEVMEQLKLGPNGGLVYCMEFLKENFSWLEERIGELPDKTYLIFDCPGQVELYTSNSAVRDIVAKLVGMDVRLAAVHLVDSHYCSDPAKFISVVLTSLTTMLQIELPHVNVLSKVDLVEKYGKLQFNLDYYTDVLDLEYILDCFPEDNFNKKYRDLNEAMTGLITDYSLVNFVPVTVKSKERMVAVSQIIDKANGYVFGSGEERNIRNMLGSVLGGADFEWSKIGEIRAQYMKTDGDVEQVLTDLEEDDEEGRVKLGNDLDKLDIGPEFQV